MKEEQNTNKIAKYLSDNIDAKEREELFAWIKEKPENKALFEDSLEIWEVAGSKSLDFSPDTNLAWEKMENRLDQSRNQEKPAAIIRPISFFRPWMRIAAAMILLGVAWWIVKTTNTGQYIEEQTLAHEKTTIELPDGSKVWLNQNSKLSYKKLFDRRVVNLEGEAFFEIEKMNGKPFEIFADKSKTKVLGTSFNVRAYPKEKQVEISVETGRVAFTAKEKPSENTLLKAGDFATFTKQSQQIKKEKIAKINAAAWKKGVLRFNNTKMTEVIQSLERYYDIKIEVSNNKIFNCKWNNTMTYTQPVLENILKEIDYASGRLVKTRKRRDKVYRFSGEGCDKFSRQ